MPRVVICLFVFLVVVTGGMCVLGRVVMQLCCSFDRHTPDGLDN